MTVLHHIAIIPDGNRRWAKKRGLSGSAGHKEGAKTVEKILEAAFEFNTPYIALWIASVGNITKRTVAERNVLFELFERFFRGILKNENVKKYGVCVTVLGRWREFCTPSLKRAIEKAEEKTGKNKKHRLTILLAYSGIDEMTAAAQSIVKSSQRTHVQKITDKTIKSHLWTHDLPPVDLVIRTGGEPHWSQGFMMWDVAEARLYFTETLWPAFSRKEFAKAIKWYKNNVRRYGK